MYAENTSDLCIADLGSVAELTLGKPGASQESTLYGCRPMAYPGN